MFDIQHKFTLFLNIHFIFSAISSKLKYSLASHFRSIVSLFAFFRSENKEFFIFLPTTVGIFNFLRYFVVLLFLLLFCFFV
jgi:hypothetical protein